MAAKKKKPASKKGTDIPRVAIDLITPYPNNTRKHTDHQIAHLVASLQEFGFVRPIIVDEQLMILAGHGVYEAAKAMGEEDIPAVIKSGLTAKQKKAYVLADNKLAEMSSWDIDMLKIELGDIPMEIAEIAGFREYEINKLLGYEEGAADAADPVEVKTDIKLGDMFQLGKHRLLCGDACNPEDVSRLFGKTVPHLMVTDPPYGVKYDPAWRNRKPDMSNISRSGRAVKKVANDDRIDWGEAIALFPGDVIYYWHAGIYGHIVGQSLIDNDFPVRAQLIWVKSNIVVGRGNYHIKHEPCLYAVRKGKTAHWNGSRKEDTAWFIDKPTKSETGHSTQKPVECMARPIVNNSKKGDAVYDPFMGSGTTMIACEEHDRKAFGIDITPEYIQIAINRWENMTGKKAKKL